MMENFTHASKLELKNIYELLGEDFCIPAYQRGYRWAPLQVKELLDDIWEFSQTKHNKESTFYCLQPIVVTQENAKWQVVDGQQRLTTLFLILHYLEQEHLRRPLSDAYKKPLYSISYETRPKSEIFLSEVHNQVHDEAATSNIDFSHMSDAYRAITEWFKDRDFNDNNLLLATLLAKLPEEHAVKVIWYDLSDECEHNEYAIDVFSRINIGKIPLTNAELVKALFLQRNHFQESQARLQQLHIASEWDAIEKRLQEPEFWHFINRDSLKTHYSTRIEYIFDLMKDKKESDEAFFTFHQFHTDFKSGKIDIDRLWKDVKNYFLTFDEWYRDRELYHLVGYLVECGEDISDLKKQAEKPGTTKTDFKNHLKNKISEQLKGCQLESLSYSENNDKPKIKKLLLLFNIQTLLASREADSRFPFDRYKRENWDIEHIRSQTDAIPTGSHRILWLKDVQDYFSQKNVNDEYRKDVDKLLQKPKIDDDAFDALYQKVRDFFEEKEESWIDNLGNLTLLDAKTNRSYKNAFFPVKRLRIISNDKRGIFVPICTKNAFLKYYSHSPEKLMYWNEEDVQHYQEAIGEILKDYLPKQEGIQA